MSDAAGYEDAAKVFLASVDYAIKGAHRFRYRWPVFYDKGTFKVLKAEIAPGKGGERDIPGLYTHVMLQAWELSHDSKYLREAECAAQYIKGEGFDLLYQTNNTIFSAIGLARLWRITHRSLYLELSRVCVANVVARFWMWNCAYGSAKKYDTFMGVGPLHEASYLAPYEESESFAACLTYLQTAGDQSTPEIRYLLAEFMKYLLHRGRFYYPQELPAKAVAEKAKEGHIDHKLWVPLEDLRKARMRSCDRSQSNNRQTIGKIREARQARLCIISSKKNSTSMRTTILTVARCIAAAIAARVSAIRPVTL